jgi:hypothetical protein
MSVRCCSTRLRRWYWFQGCRRRQWQQTARFVECRLYRSTGSAMALAARPSAWPALTSRCTGPKDPASDSQVCKRLHFAECAQIYTASATAILHFKHYRINNGMTTCSQLCVQVQHLLHVAIACKSCKTVQTIRRCLPSMQLFPPGFCEVMRKVITQWE